MENVLNKTKNYFKCIGVVSELDLKREDCSIAIKDTDGNDNGKINGEQIRGNIVVKTDNGLLTFRVFFRSHNVRPDKNGKYENSRWKMATDMMELVPEIGGKENPSLVDVEGTIDVNDYCGQDGKIKTIVQLNASKVSTSRVNPDEVHGCTWEGVMYIKSIAPETVTKNDEQEETGRLVINLLGINGKSECFPVKAYVAEEMAEAFEDMFEEEQTVPMTIDIVNRHVGGKKSQAKRAFGGKGSVDVNNGFDITEYMIVGADEPIEESEIEDENGNPINNGYINPKTMKKALKERAKKLEEIESNGYQSGNTKNSIKEQKQKFAKAKHTANLIEDDDDDDLF